MDTSTEESKLLPKFVAMLKKDAVSGLTAVKEALTLCNDCNLRQITGSRIVRIQADGGGEFNNQKLKDLCFDKNITLSFSPSPARRLLKQAHLERQWSCACKFAEHMMREKVLGRPWTRPSRWYLERT